MKNSRSVIAASVVALALVPFFAGALTVADLQAQIQTLLAQIAALQQQTNTLVPVATTSVTNIPSATASSTPSAPPSISGIVCPVFNYTLASGSTGAAVSALQKFLSDHGFLTAGSITGFYGSLTEAAVRNFQAQQGIVSSGSADTTGWGVVGKQTSAAIVKVCSSGFAPPLPANPVACTAIALSCPAGEHDQVGANCSHACVSTPAVSTCAANPPPVSSCTSGWKPNVDPNGCTISYSCTTSTGQTSSASSGTCPYYPVPDCGGGLYAQWLGNGSGGCSLGYTCVSSSNPAGLSCPSYPLPACNSGTLLSQGTDANGCQLAPLCAQNVAAPSSNFSASPISGSAPLTVTFTGVGGSITFGNGMGLSASDNGVIGETTYTYTSSGTYIATSNGTSITITAN